MVKDKIGDGLEVKGVGSFRAIDIDGRDDLMGGQVADWGTNFGFSKKTTKPDELVSKAVVKHVEPVVPEPTSVTIPSKTGVFRRLKLKYGGSPTSNVVRKPHITHQGVVMREVPAPVSPHSKKRRAEDMAKKISKKKKKTKKRQLVIPTESSKEEEGLETPELEPIIEPTFPEKIVVIQPEVSSTKSSHDDVRTLDINANVSDTGVNVIMGEGDLSKETTQPPQGTPITISVEPITSTFVSLPPYIIPTTSTTDSPTFQNIIDQPFTSIFSSQSNHPPKANDESDNEEGGFGGTSEDMAFDEEEEDFPDHMLMSMKQFKILNKKQNSIIQSQADMGGGSSSSTFEIDELMKAFEARMYVGAVKELTNIQKEQHILFVIDVKKVREDVNLKHQELQDDMFLSQKFTQFEAVLHKQLAPLSTISNILPTGAPPIRIGVQGGEKRVGEGSHVKAGGDALHGEAKVVGKVYPSKIPLTKPTISSAGTVTSTIVTSMPITKLIYEGDVYWFIH
ncbi:unnamed protein product [Lactuca saligna]|uniref:Uncharacterized protein n=1 Tax=Lactuca saligna TaxID=75948 RepID=A0AA35VK11_LACSI|nr:unnamed protein product [Lactuca saligna]